MGDFLKQLAKNKKQLEYTNQQDLNAVEGLLSQAASEKSHDFATFREGNEVLVDCSKGSPQLLDPIAKDSDHSPVDRAKLVDTGIALTASTTVTLSIEEQRLVEQNPEIGQSSSPEPSSGNSCN